MAVPNDSEVLSESDTISAITEYGGTNAHANHVASSQNVGGSPSSDDVMLAPMRAITNPTFWDDMMMPGFSWNPIQNPPEFYQQFTTTTAS